MTEPASQTPATPRPAESPALPARRNEMRSEPSAVSRRAIWIGMGLVVLVAALTPYNDDLSPKNSPFIGNHFPIGILTLMAVLILVINPLLTWLRKKALATGELIVIMTLMLVGAAVPSSGLMRYLEPMVISPFWLARDYPWWRPIADLMPAWLAPTKDMNSNLISDYWLGIDPVRGGNVPILAFLIPLVVWGILMAAILGAAMFLAAIFRKQWVHHERLTFPLATIPLELLAAPEEGRFYNRLWRNPVLWAGMAIPALVYLLAGLHGQIPSIPYVDLNYDVQSAFHERPWDALPVYMQSARLYLAVVGICFFVPSEIAFSLWLFVVLEGLARVVFAQTSVDIGRNENTRAMGTYAAYFAGLLWLARGHLKHVIVQAWRGMPREEGEALSYRVMMLGWLICMAVAWIWLMAVGMSPVVALLLLAVGTMLITLMARVVAETGLFFVGPVFWPRDLVAALVSPKLVNMVSFYWTQIVSGVFFGDLRETLMPFAINSLRMGQELKSEERPRWFKKLCIALIVSALVSGAMHHYLSYTRGRTAIEDGWASSSVPEQLLRGTYRWTNAPQETTLGTSWTHFLIGAAMVVGLMAGRVTWAGWPFHPIGLVLMGSGPMQQVWFSILVGWGVKRLLLRYGGAMAFRRARPFFIGLILGEMLSAGLWMFVGLLSNGAVRFTFLPS